MPSRAKNIQLFLIDGSASGRIKCTLSNWTGVVYLLPRTHLAQCGNRDDLKQAGVYLLFSGDEETDQPKVYIGQASQRKNGQSVLTRLGEHVRSEKRGYWTQAIAIVTSNNSFGNTEISFLENYFYNEAKRAGRYIVENDKDPSLGTVTEEKRAELEEFIEYAKLVIGALGKRVFEPLNGSSDAGTGASEPGAEEPLLYFKVGEAYATGRQTSDGFAVLAGSKLRADCTRSCSASTHKSRKKYQDRISPDWILTEDVLLSSPSGAAGFVGGASLNGNDHWKSAEGVRLGDLEARELSAES